MVKSVWSERQAIFEKRKQAATYQSAVKQIEEAAIPPHVVTKLTKFQSLLNMIFERSTRECLEDSLLRHIANLNQIQTLIYQSMGVQSPDQIQTPFSIQDIRKMAEDAIFQGKMRKRALLKTSMTFEKKEICLVDSLEVWRCELIHIVTRVVDKLQNISCLCTSELGFARTNEKMGIIDSDDTFLVESITALKQIIDNILHIPGELVRLLRKYEYIMIRSKTRYKNQYMDNNITIEQFRTELDILAQAREDVNVILEGDEIFCGGFLINCAEIKVHLLKKIEQNCEVIFECIKARMEEDNQMIEKHVDDILEVITGEVTSIEKLDYVRNYIKTIEEPMKNVDETIKNALDKMGLLEQHQYKLSAKEFVKTWDSFSKPLKIFKARRECTQKLFKLENVFKEDLRIETATLLEEMGDLGRELEALQRREVLDNYAETFEEFQSLGNRIEEAIEEANIVNNRENICQFNPTNTGVLFEIKEKYQPFHTLWKLATDFFYNYPEWMNGFLSQIERDTLTNQIANASDTLKKLEKVDLKEYRGPCEVTRQLFEKFENFKPYLPLICDLLNPSLKYLFCNSY